MKRFLLMAVLLAGCMTTEVETPDRAIIDFTGETVTIDSITTSPSPKDVALAKSACANARYQTKLIDFSQADFAGLNGSRYLFIC